MKAERNQRIVEVFFESLDRGDAEALLAAYAPDATVWTAGSLPFSGTHTLDQLPEFMGDILSQFPEGLRFTVTGITAGDDRVAVEAESEGRHQNGRRYHNQYHFLFILRDGKIVQMKEYLDTMLAHQFLVPNP